MKKIIVTLFLTLILIGTTISCYANYFVGNNQFYLKEQGIFIDLQEDVTNYYNIIEEINKKNSTLEQNPEAKQKLLEQIEQYKLVLLLTDSLDQNITKQIMVSCEEDQASTQIYDLNTFEDNKLQNYYNQYITSLRDTIEIASSELIQLENGEVYILYDTSGNYDGKEINSYSYFTIKNGKFITINITFLDLTYGKQDANAIIQNIKFDNQYEGIFVTEEDYSMFVSLISLIALIVILIIKKFVKMNDKKEISVEEENKYKKIGGFYIVYIITVILTLLNNIIGLLTSQSLQTENVVVALVRLESIVTIVINLIILIHIIKNRKINIIEKLIFNCGIVNIVILFLIGCCALSINEILVKSSYQNMIHLIISNTMYTIIWGCYFKLSKRIQVLGKE